MCTLWTLNTLTALPAHSSEPARGPETVMLTAANAAGDLSTPPPPQPPPLPSPMSPTYECARRRSSFNLCSGSLFSKPPPPPPPPLAAATATISDAATSAAAAAEPEPVSTLRNCAASLPRCSPCVVPYSLSKSSTYLTFLGPDAPDGFPTLCLVVAAQVEIVSNT